MAERTSIEWTDATWTPIKGCTRKSAGCTHCYAEIMAARFSGPGQWGEGLARIVDTPTGKDHRWTGVIRLDERELLKPFGWKRPRMIFVCSTSDLFHEGVGDAALDRVFAVMTLLPQHTFQVLTKRASRMRKYLTGDGAMPPWIRIQGVAAKIAAQAGVPAPKGTLLTIPSNIWLGVSAETQETADQRVPDLLRCPGFVRWVSAEPLLGPLDLSRYMKEPVSVDDPPALDWIVAGGESGPGARPMHPDWVRSLRDQCERHDVAFLFKQFGAWGPGAIRMSTGEAVFRSFSSFDQWVSKAPTWVNGGSCIDMKGRLLRIGADFMRARDDGSFPVAVVHRLGRKRAGRLLDGIEHNDFPFAAEVPFG